ncbi:DUF5694 domain-containing protein [Jatrophihabitans sp.]|uniref:DUF5694 domain-containing protein n=1 Tax=Jatrophihabitans sp. TaxID=1932789 RepID=UPI0030C76B53|nr:hypothetical protein [Jatrophihabitans sp.]
MLVRISFFIIIGLLTISFANAQPEKVEILLLGCDHLSQIYKKGNPETDVFTEKRQKEIFEIVSSIKRYQPDMIMVEELPEEQNKLDSLYNLFRQNKLVLQNLEGGRSEIYQLAFNAGKQLNLNKIHCVNAPGGTSQSILDNGENIHLYKEETAALREIVKEKGRQIQNGSLSFTDYVRFLNEKETVQKTYHLKYITPARITNGTFKNPDNMVDTAFINPKYIGAELSAIFRNRDYKIYSNIVTNQLITHSKKILLIIGQAHIGSLQSIFRDDPAYTLADTQTYLK